MKDKLVASLICLLISSCFVYGGDESIIKKTDIASADSTNMMQETVTQLIADNIELNLKIFASSIKALGDEYIALYKTTAPMSENECKQWLTGSKREKKTLIFHPYSIKSTPTYQAPFPSYLYYKNGNPSQKVWRELKIFKSLSSSFKISFNTFQDSWVYMTTVNEAFMIFPYLPLKQAVNNTPPTEQTFYTAADFKNKTFGWTSPYLDLVGAGMMVTVCYPVYEKNKLLGVISRDITLSQLSEQMLSPITKSKNKLVSIIIDKTGLAIANSDRKAMNEINQVNKKAGSAVLYYRENKDLSLLKVANAQNSSMTICNEVGSKVLNQIKQKPNSKTSKFDINSKMSATAVKITSTGWLVVTFRTK